MIGRGQRIVVAMTVIAAGAALSCGSGGRRAPSIENEALALLAAGDTATAIHHIESSGLTHRGDPQLYVLLGLLYREQDTISGRLRSQRVLERGLQRYPEHPQILLELGKTYYAQSFFPDAVRCFNAALSADRGFCEAYRYLGLYYYSNWKRVQQYVDDLLAARRHFAAAVACDSSDLESTTKLAFSLYALDRPAEAAGVVSAALDRFPDRSEFYQLRGAMAYDRKDLESAATDFTLALERMDEPLRRAHADVLNLLSYQERPAYKKSPDHDREITERGYWLDVDPDPTTAFNERMVEHCYRMFKADLYFSVERPEIRGWDTERGATVVKFGWPWEITSTLGEGWKTGRVENWYYLHRGRLREFVFVDEYLTGNLRVPIVADSMMYVLHFEPLRSGYQPESADVGGVLDVTAFRDDAFSSAVYLCARIDADSLAKTVDPSGVNHFYFRGTFFDEGWTAEERFADTLWTSDVHVGRAQRSRFYFLPHVVNVPFDVYHVACAFEDEAGRTRTILKSRCDSHRFIENKLCVSDILLQVDPARNGGFVVRNGRRLFPNPGRMYGADERLSAYFEVYNLSMSQRRTDYDLTYYIVDDPGTDTSDWRELATRVASFLNLTREKRPAVSQTFRRRGASYSEEEGISINIDTLPEGRYQLIVTVKDRVSGQYAETGVAFQRLGNARMR